MIIFYIKTPAHLLVFATYCFLNNTGVYLYYTVCDNFVFTFFCYLMKYLSVSLILNIDTSHRLPHVLLCKFGKLFRPLLLVYAHLFPCYFKLKLAMSNLY